MHELLFANVRKHVSLSAADESILATAFRARRLAKKQFLLQAGEIARHETFVVKGLLRAYTVDATGNEHIAMFASEGWWIGDLYSFLTETPATQSIDALEDTDVLQVERGELERLYEQIPQLNRFFRILLQNAFVANQQRVLAAISQTAEEQYHAFVKKFPSIEQRVPQHQVASYLGITPETISRIRRQRNS